jgi:hypothetical protein
MVLVVLEVPSDTASAENPRCVHLPRQTTAAGTLNTDTATPIVTLLSVTDLDRTVLSNLELCLPGREDEICQPHAGLHNVM